MGFTVIISVSISAYEREKKPNSESNKKAHTLERILDMEALLNSKQVMQLLNIRSETTLIKYEREGRITPSIRIGNRKRYSAKSIKRLMGE